MPTILIPGVDRGAKVRVVNRAIASQAPVAATRTYLAGSALAVPVDGLKAGAILRWRLSATKTAAGTATSTFDICFGTAGTTADTARVSFTKPAGTAAADEAFVDVEAVVRSVSATGVVVGMFKMAHNLAATGHLQIPAAVVATVSSAFDNSAAGLIVGLCLTTGASDAITIEHLSAELIQ
jgi:hypothetical protein